MNEGKEFRQMAESHREIADVYDKIADVIEDEALDSKEREKKQDALMGELLVKVMKMQ
ncbi:MAG: hypothetical protein IJ439_03665 [Tyzzerella sp.]|nr:hypothetical protein [Tyzzerella sp.]